MSKQVSGLFYETYTSFGTFSAGGSHVVLPGQLTINQIKDILHTGRVEKRFLESCQADPRQGVRALAVSHLKDKNNLAAEDLRLEKMFNFESDLWQEGYTNLAGIDEVGRGPLAGPVVAAAVIFEGKEKIQGLNDSKKVPEAKRVEMAREIRKRAKAWSIGVANIREIGELNILGATKTAMMRAVDGLGMRPCYLLIDAVNLNHNGIPGKPIINGDALSASIAAASILAKVYRDSLMNKLHREYPYYNFASNKGYLTSEHTRALELYGPCPAHRTSFAPLRKV